MLHKNALCALLLVLCGLIPNAFGQAAALRISSASAPAAGTAALTVTLTTPNAAPAGLQFKIAYSSNEVASISAIAGPGAIQAGKAIYCAPASGAYGCILAGLNTNGMTGDVAIVNITLAPQAASATLSLSDALGATAAADAMNIALPGPPFTIAGSGTALGAALVFPVALSCATSTLSAGDMSTCAVTLSGSAPVGGISLPLSATGALNVPPLVGIPQGSATGSFAISAIATLTDQNSTVTVSYPGHAQTAALLVAGPASLTALSCATATLDGNGSTQCTVALSRAAPSSGASVSLNSSNWALSVPASVTIPPGMTSAGFAVSAGGFSVDQTATLTASYNASHQSATLLLSAHATLSQFSCSVVQLPPGALAACTVSLSRPATADTPVTIASNNSSVWTPPSITVAANSSLGFLFIYVYDNAQGGAVTLTASISGPAGRTSLTTTLILTGPGRLTNLSCSPSKLSVGGTSTCTVALSPASGDTALSVSATSGNLAVPSSVAIPAGATSASFNVTAKDASIPWIVLTATDSDGSTQRVLIIVNSEGDAPPLMSLRCTPSTRSSHTEGLCTLTLNPPPQTGVSIPITTRGGVRAPAGIAVAAHQQSVAFRVNTTRAGGRPHVSLAIHDHHASDEFAANPGADPGIQVPENQIVRYGTPLRFTVAAMDPGVSIGVSNLPDGAQFSADTGAFDWTPEATQQGVYNLKFTSGQPPASAGVRIEVTDGAPRIASLVNAATNSPDVVCSPGGLAAISGNLLIDDATADPAVPGARIAVNDTDAPVVYATATRVSFVCPALPSGTPLRVMVSNSYGSASATTTMNSYAPGLFTHNSGSAPAEAVALLAGSGEFATVRNPDRPGRPARSGETLVIFATGLADIEPGGVTLRFGDTVVTPDRVVALTPGIDQIWIHVPPLAQAAGYVDLSADVLMMDGTAIRTNSLTLAVEK